MSAIPDDIFETVRRCSAEASGWIDSANGRELMVALLVAERERGQRAVDEALERAAEVANIPHKDRREWVPSSFWNILSRDAAERIRALKTTMQDGGRDDG